MKKWMKNLYAMLLVIVLIATMIPTSVLAAPGGGRGHSKGLQKKETVIEEVETVETSSEDATSETEEQVTEPVSTEEMAVTEEEIPAEDTTEAENDVPATEIPFEEAVEPAIDEIAVEEVTPTAEVTPEPEVEEKAEEEKYPAVTFDKNVAGINVHVDAPKGALPEGTTIQVVYVDPNKVQNAVDKAADVDGTVVAAVDITFYDKDNNPIEPKEAIKVTITSDEIANIENPAVVHVDVKAEEIETANVAAEPVDQVPEPSAADEVVFEADSFSVYAIVSGDTTITNQITYHFLDGNGFIIEHITDSNDNNIVHIMPMKRKDIK